MTIYCTFVTETDTGKQKKLMVREQDEFHYCEEDLRVQIGMLAIKKSAIMYLALVFGEHTKIIIDKEAEECG